MATKQEGTLRAYEQLQPGDRVELKHDIKVGFREWQTTTVGIVVRCERRRHGQHRQRNADDKVYSDMIILRKDDGSVTTVTLDEFTSLRKIDG